MDFRDKKYIIKYILSLIFVIFAMLMIFDFSAATAEESSHQSEVVVDTVIKVTDPNFEKKPVPVQHQKKSDLTTLIRKSAHFLEFALLGFALVLHTKILGIRFYRLTAMAVGLLYAIFDEWHQNFVEGRGPGIKDVLIDFGGVVCGISVMLIFAWIIGYILKSRKKKTAEAE